MQEAADDLAADGNEQPGLVGLLWERPFNPQRWAHRSDIHEEASVKVGARRVRAFVMTAADVGFNRLGRVPVVQTEASVGQVPTYSLANRLRAV